MTATLKLPQEPREERANPAIAVEQCADADADVPVLGKHPAIPLDTFVLKIDSQGEAFAIEAAELGAAEWDVGVGADDAIARTPAAAEPRGDGDATRGAVRTHDNSGGDFPAV